MSTTKFKKEQSEIKKQRERINSRKQNIKYINMKDTKLHEDPAIIEFATACLNLDFIQPECTVSSPEICSKTFRRFADSSESLQTSHFYVSRFEKRFLDSRCHRFSLVETSRRPNTFGIVPRRNYYSGAGASVMTVITVHDVQTPSWRCFFIFLEAESKGSYVTIGEFRFSPWYSPDDIPGC